MKAALVTVSCHCGDTRHVHASHALDFYRVHCACPVPEEPIRIDPEERSWLLMLAGLAACVCLVLG